MLHFGEFIFSNIFFIYCISCQERLSSYKAQKEDHNCRKNVNCNEPGVDFSTKIIHSTGNSAEEMGHIITKNAQYSETKNNEFFFAQIYFLKL